MGLVEIVMPGNQAREHSGVGRVNVARQQGQADPWNRFHAEHLEDRDMAVPATDQHEILDNRGVRFIHLMSRLLDPVEKRGLPNSFDSVGHPGSGREAFL